MTVHKYYLGDVNNLKVCKDDNESIRRNIIDKLYNLYAPKVYGFILTYTNNEQEAQNYLSDVFTHAANNPRFNDEVSENRILLSVLLVCKPLYKSKLLAP